MCLSARQDIRHKKWKMGVIILKYYGSKAWYPATLRPELVLRPTCISQKVDMNRERAAAEETGQIGARARSEWEYITTLVTCNHVAFLRWNSDLLAGLSHTAL